MALGSFTVKGKAAALQLFEVVGETGQLNSWNRIELPFAGREQELAALRQLVDSPAGSSSEGVVLYGDAGVGKSRLLAQFTDSLGDHVVLRLASEPNQQMTPYAAVAGGLRRLLGLELAESPQAEVELRRRLADVIPTHAAYWPLVADVLRLTIATTPEVEALTDANRPERTLRLIVALLEALDLGSVVIAVEDGQWVDASSAGLLAALAAETQSRPWLMVVTRRGDVASQDGLVLNDAIAFPIEPLSPGDSMIAMRRATGATPLHRSQLEAIVAKSGGNPLFLSALLQAAIDTGSLETAPDSLPRAINAQLNRLDPPTMRVVGMASVLGARFRSSHLADLLEREKIVVDSATAEHVDRMFAVDGDEVSFRHGLIRDAAYESMSFRRRRDLHRRAGLMMEERARRGEQDDAALAFHFAAAKDDAKTFRYAHRAALASERAFAPIEAAEQYRRAIAAGRRLRHSGEPTIRDLWLSRARVLDHAGLFDDALEALSRASRLSASPQERAEVEVRRARVQQHSGSFVAALAANTRARSHLARSHREGGDDGHRALRASASAQAAIVFQVQGRFKEAVRAAEETIAEAVLCGDQHALAQAYGVLAGASLVAGDQSAATLGVQSLELFEAIGDREGQARMTNNLGVEAYYRGDLAQAIAYYERCAQIATKSGAVIDAAQTRANIGEIFLQQNRLAEAEEIFVQSQQDTAPLAIGVRQ
ncbi:MAG: AAA family ATPase [Acidimicrobiales bacterium]